MLNELFGTDGIRGIANKDLTPEMAFYIGRICTYLLRKEEEDMQEPFIVLGKDTRRSCNMLEGALTAGICSSGMNVRSLGVLSTPALAYLTKELNAAAGIMISASHNPIEDNGLKIFSPTGYKIADDIENNIEDIYFGEDPLPRPIGGEIGKLEEDEHAAHIYLEFLQKSAPSLDGMHIAMDCGHGAVYELAPELFRSLGARLTVLNNQPNGVNINVKCGSTNPSALQSAVLENNAHLGLAFDGDADRLIAVDEKGEIVDGDLLMLIFSLHLQEKNLLNKNTLVSTIMSNGGLEIAANRHGIDVVRTKVGDRYVLEKMREGGFSLGGEQSGHIIFFDYATTGDGLLSALKLTEIVKEKGQPLSSYRSLMPHLPQVMVNCQVNKKEGWDKIPAFQKAMEETYTKIGPNGRILVRPSGTESKIRIMVEGEEEENVLHNYAKELADILSKELNS